MYADGLVLCGESEEEMRVMTHRLLIVCKRCVPNVNANKVKLMVLGGEEGSVRESSGGQRGSEKNKEVLDLIF